jgi:serine/threonine protein kinase/tetratricopeptide (TPR) repeat protein
MSDESRLRKLEKLFLECLDLPPPERAGFLEDRCRGDGRLRDEVLDLLARESRAESMLPPPVIVTVPAGPEPADDSEGSGRLTRPSTQALPDSVGPYRILRQLGEGGFGEVYEAEQATPVRRRVALKVLKAGMDSKGVLARFEVERQALALMEHPSIAKVYDAGMTEAGRSYFAMELVSGQSISQYCDQQRLSLRERLVLFVAVCRAVEHAHQKGIIHRDLKPSNILVAATDGRPHPRIIDFGIAKATTGALSGETLHTRAGDFLGTPEFMSPEQAASGGVDVDTRTDVYSLGVVLFRLLTGRLPFDPERLRRVGIAEVQRLLREEDPPKPSQVHLAAESGSSDSSTGRADRASAGAGSAPCAGRELRGDLDWIVLKAMAKEREVRYPSAAAFADDIERHLRDVPVLAAAPSAAYRLQKLVRRRRGPVAGGLLVVVALAVGLATSATIAAGAAAAIVVLLAGLAATVRQAGRARRAEAEARGQAEVATAVNALLTRMLLDANPELNPRGHEVTLREVVDRAAHELDEKMSAPALVEAGVRHALGSTYMGLGLYEEAQRQVQRAAELWRRERGSLAAETIESRILLADVTVRGGDYATAESQLRVLGQEIEALPALRAEARERYLRTRGANLANLGRYDEAESFLAAAVAMRRDLSGDGGTELARSLMELCRLCRRQGRYEAATAAGREALDAFRRCHIGDHVDIATAASRLAAVLRTTHDLDEAEQLQREAIAIYTRLLGPTHANTAFALGNLGVVLNEAGRFREAIPLDREAIATLERSLGPDHPEVLNAQDNLAVALQETGALEEALALRLSSLERTRRAAGDTHPDVATALNNLGALYRLLGRSELAIPVFGEALAIFRLIHGEGHPEVVIAMNNLGKAHLDLGRAEEAEAQFTAGLALAGDVWPAEHANAGLLRSNRGLALAALGRVDEAERELLAGHEVIAGDLGLEHPRSRRVAGEIARFYEERGTPDQAARWRAAASASERPPASASRPGPAGR